MKRIVAIFLAFVIFLSLTACINEDISIETKQSTDYANEHYNQLVSEYGVADDIIDINHYHKGSDDTTETSPNSQLGIVFKVMNDFDNNGIRDLFVIILKNYNDTLYLSKELYMFNTNGESDNSYISSEVSIEEKQYYYFYITGTYFVLIEENDISHKWGDDSNISYPVVSGNTNIHHNEIYIYDLSSANINDAVAYFSKDFRFNDRQNVCYLESTPTGNSVVYHKGFKIDSADITHMLSNENDGCSYINEKNSDILSNVVGQITPVTWENRWHTSFFPDRKLLSNYSILKIETSNSQQTSGNTTMSTAKIIREVFETTQDITNDKNSQFIENTVDDVNKKALLLAGYDDNLDSDIQKKQLDANRLSVDYVETALKHLSISDIKKHYMEDDKKNMSASEFVDILQESFKNTTDSDLSVIYYSGHTYTNHTTLFSGISFQKFYELIKNNVKGTVLLMYDGCYAGELMNLNDYDDRIKILAACDEDDYSSSYYLSEIDENSDEKQICSIFAYALYNGVINNINYLDSNNDNTISFNELYIYLLNSVYNICDRITTQEKYVNYLKDKLGLDNVVRLAQIVQAYPDSDETPLFTIN